MGITQHVTGTDNVKSCANLAMLSGKVGFESAGVNPLRGQNNVQGACDMGALPNVYTGYQPVADVNPVKKNLKKHGEPNFRESRDSPSPRCCKAEKGGTLRPCM